MFGFDNLWVWDDRMRAALPWYYAVSLNEKPAKYLICKRIPVEISLKGSSEGELWNELDKLTPRFLELWSGIKSSRIKLRDVPKARPNLLDLCAELAQRMLAHCYFCRWNCQVDRSRGTKHGTCQLESASRVSSYFHHRGEELIYRGKKGSGTIFFTSCNMRCAFCQNGDISTDKDNGIEVTPGQLAAMAWQLRMEGCHNVNWVGGEVTIHLHTIVEAVALLGNDFAPQASDTVHVMKAKSDFLPSKHYPEYAYCDGEFNAPMLWNSNFFMSREAMKILRLLMDIWLPDFKFGSDGCSIKLSRTPWYWETVTGNLLKIHQWGEDFTIRHLVMPNHVECCTRPVLEWIKANMPGAPVNIMDQFHPDNYCDPMSSKYNPKYAELSRYPTDEEISEAFDYARRLGLNFEALSYEKNML